MKRFGLIITLIFVFISICHGYLDRTKTMNITEFDKLYDAIDDSVYQDAVMLSYWNRLTTIATTNPTSRYETEYDREEREADYDPLNWSGT
jgi:hypothetical protein